MNISQPRETLDTKSGEIVPQKLPPLKSWCACLKLDSDLPQGDSGEYGDSGSGFQDERCHDQ